MTTVDTGEVEGFQVTEVSVGSEVLTVAVADTPGLRGRGLMGVTDLGELDGMLFVFTDESRSGFTMENTLIPLDIAFFDAAGNPVDQLVMEPCLTDPCPIYRSEGDYLHALEMREGTMGSLTAEDVLVP